ncbi:unnamed protein product [Parascedosporium putredinis]|uniref:DUF1531-domain-containing protein n=1 Tax=Parascedosporium putredinis TaxID=1442378 RepID=A0A9P1GUL2_9PEZI|nr:unnamed protein product [Parascedosporium putredinis]CAI7987398.1 unnamed protein product [Parascedosporium putredinis]
MADILNRLRSMAEAHVANIGETWASLDLHRILRLVMIIGAYLLLRPYLVKMTGASQMEQHEREDAETKKRAAEISPNQMRGGLRVAAEIPDADEVDTSTSADWGSKARKRQREVLKKMLEVEETRLSELQEDDEDKDIEEFLIKEDK